jgi:hypothetical protein
MFHPVEQCQNINRRGNGLINAINETPEQKRSLNALRKANKTKPSSPDFTGQMKLQRRTAAAWLFEARQRCYGASSSGCGHLFRFS